MLLVAVCNMFKGRCVSCGKIGNVFYHHTQYQPTDLVAICHSCHVDVHYGDSRIHDPTEGKHRRKWLQRKELELEKKRRLNKSLISFSKTD